MPAIIGMGTPRDPRALALETRRKRHVRNVLRPEMPPAFMADVVQETLKNHEDVELVSASAIYNCYGMVFAARRSAIIDELEVKKILDDDKYEKLPWMPASWLPGDIVLYWSDELQNVTHAAVVVDVTPSVRSGEFEIKVQSAWGDVGEYLHRIDDVPSQYGKPCEARSQRFLL